jgi:hypothetical protein
MKSAHLEREEERKDERNGEEWQEGEFQFSRYGGKKTAGSQEEVYYILKLEHKF